MRNVTFGHQTHIYTFKLQIAEQFQLESKVRRVAGRGGDINPSHQNPALIAAAFLT